MAYLGVDFDQETREALREALADMVNPVDIHVFVADACEYCDATVKLIENIAAESPEKGGGKLIRVHIHRREDGDEFFEKHGVERVPAVTMIDGMIKYTGIPAGEEVRGLVETIIRISTGDSGLDESTKRFLAEELDKPVHVETIVTPQCPYCPYAALLANMFAYEAWKAGKRNFLSETVEAYENPDIADKYSVMSVPAIAINGMLAFVGVPYEEDFVRRIREIVKEKKTGVESFGGAMRM